MKEIWKDIHGYEGLYQVSNLGQVKSLKFGKERILKFNLSSNNYYSVELYLNGKNKRILVHQLVAMVFLDHVIDGHKIEVDHIDGNRYNNTSINLQLLTTKEHTNKDWLGSGVGCYWNKPRNKWQSHIKINGKAINLGGFINKQDAIDMHQKAVANIHLYNGDAKAFRLALTT